MSFTSPHMIRGWFTEIPSWRGRDGTRIPESGLAARISRSDSALELAGSAVLDGAGVIGDSIGITDYAIYNHGRYFSRSSTFYNRNNLLPGRGRARRNSGMAARGGVWRPAVNSRRRSGQAFQRKPPGCSRIRRTPRPERRPLGRLQRLRPWRRGKELFVTRKRQLGGGGGWRRSAVEDRAAAAARQLKRASLCSWKIARI